MLQDKFIQLYAIGYKDRVIRRELELDATEYLIMKMDLQQKGLLVKRKQEIMEGK